MKYLYLIRHAKSSWEHPELTDFERPLNKRGKSDAPVMGNRLKKKGIKPDLIISSPAKRALKTATRIAKELNYAKEAIILNEDVYEATVVDLLDVIHQQSDKIKHLFIFGHNPGFTNLANVLVNHFKIENIPTCGVCCVQFDVKSWEEIDEGKGKIHFFDFPKQQSAE